MTSQKTKGSAAILALLFGGIGAHKFYLGQTGQGILYLLFAWTFVPLFIAFFEALRYALMNQADFDRQYNHRHLAHASQPRQLPQQPQQMGQNITINLSDHAQGQRQPQGHQQQSPSSQQHHDTGRVSVAAELKELKELQVAGVLTQEEFQAQKRRLLSDSQVPARHHGGPPQR